MRAGADLMRDAAQLGIGAHRLIVAAALQLEMAGAILMPEAEAEIADLIEDVGDFADVLADIAAGRPQRQHDDGLPSNFAKVAEEFRLSRRAATLPSKPAKRRRAA